MKRIGFLVLAILASWVGWWLLSWIALLVPWGEYTGHDVNVVFWIGMLMIPVLLIGIWSWRVQENPDR